ncbi:MAG: 3-phosphoshikimate 1-carboxyvinyltransferase [Pirellulaceae bacterium]
MMPTRKIQTVPGPIAGTIRPPGSKSLTNRALLLAALAQGTSRISGLLDSEDTRVMLNALQTLGVSIQVDWTKGIAEVAGTGGRFPKSSAVELDVQNSGTTIRFLTAALTAAGGQFSLRGIPRMHQRPIGDLVRALQSLGGGVSAQGNQKFPPVEIASAGLRGGTVQVAGNLSSQFLSGLLMAAPLAQATVEIVVIGNLVSQPYVRMTLANMKSFGVNVRTEGASLSRFIIEPQAYRATDFSIEPDASAASYFFAAAAICGGSSKILGLNRNSLQGDVAFVNLLERMGCHVVWGDEFIEVQGPARIGIECEMSDISDTVQTLAAVSLFVNGPTTIRGIAHNRLKETDRIGDLAIELRKLGASVTEHADGFMVIPGALRGAILSTYNDHRMAMSLALVGLKVRGVEIENPDCVVKTYPNYFDDLDQFVGGEGNQPNR